MSQNERSNRVKPAHINTYRAGNSTFALSGPEEKASLSLVGTLNV